MSRIKTLKKFGFNSTNRTYVIAEIGINHGGDVALAKELIASAAQTGADAVKFQTYITEKRVPTNNKVVFEILKKCEFSFDILGELKAYAENLGIDFFSTAFDVESLEYLESIDCKMYKIASFDVVNKSLLSQIADTGKPVIMSVGMSNEQEISDAYRILKKGTNNIAILHCISAYPVEERDVNLAAIYRLQDDYDCIIGYSDHTPNITTSLLAVAAGAQIIEKHYKIMDGMECADAAVSITEKQMRDMVSEIHRIEKMFGNGTLGIRDVEKPIVSFRRPS